MGAVNCQQRTADRSQFVRHFPALDADALTQSPALHIKLNLSLVHHASQP